MQYTIVTFRKDKDRHSINPTPLNSFAEAELHIHNIVLHGPNRDVIGYMIMVSSGDVYYYDWEGGALGQHTKPWV